MNLTTWRSAPKASRTTTNDVNTDIAPIGSLQYEVNRLFDQFFDSWPVMGTAPRYVNNEVIAFYPKMDIGEDDKTINVCADLPGMTDKDIEVTLAPGMLTIRGERKEETNRKEAGYTLCERTFGQFERSFALPNGLDIDKAHATFKNGALTVALPKTAEARKAVRKLELTGHN